MITQEHLDLLEEMIDFPQVYRLSDDGLETVKSLYKELLKIKENGLQNS